MYEFEFGDPVHPPTELLGLLGSSFREFYSGVPWHERWRCPACNPPDDYGPTGRYDDAALTNCPMCDAALEPFWSDRRTLRYFATAMNKPGAWLLLTWQEQELVGWIWGYATAEVDELAAVELPADYTYVDVICILRRHRGKLTQDFVRRLQHDLTTERGAAAIVCRTHQGARPVQLLLRATHWVPLEAKSLDDPDREYWVYYPEKAL